MNLHTKSTDRSDSDADLETVKRADNVLLAKLGYKSEFRRDFSLIETIAFAFSIMGLVSAISTTLSFPLVGGGHVGMVFGWLIPCFFVFTVALSMAELTSSMPTSAGLYYFAAKLAPDGYGPLASWITGWANITGQVALVCGIDFTTTQMITTAIIVGTDGATIPSPGATYGMFLAILFTHGILCSAATKVIARLNVLYTIINLVTTFAAIIALLVVSGDKKVSARDAFFKFENNTGWQNNGLGFLLSFAAPMWILTGYDSAAHISEEIAGAAQAAPIAILAGVGATAVLAWILLIATSFVIPSIGDLLATQLPLPMGQVFLDVLGKQGMLSIWPFIIVVGYFTGVAQGVDASRTVFAFSRDGALPGSKWWRRINTSTRTPVNAVWLVMVLSGLCGLVGFSEAALSSFAGASVVGLYTSYTVPIFISVTGGRKKMILGPFNLGRWSRPIGIIAVAWVAFIIVLLLFPPGQDVIAGNMNYTIVITGSVLVFASVSWVVSARKWFRGPVKTIEESSANSEEHNSPASDPEK